MGVGVTLGIVLFPAISSRMELIPTSALPYLVLLFKEVFLGLALSFLLETCLVTMVLLLLIAQLTCKGDMGAKIGLLILAAPLFVHYYGPLTYRLFDGEEALWSDLPEQVRHAGDPVVLAAHQQRRHG